MWRLLPWAAELVLELVELIIVWLAVRLAWFYVKIAPRAWFWHNACAASWPPLALVLLGAGLLAAVHGKPGRLAAQCAGHAGAGQFAAWLVSGAAGCGSHQAGRFRHG